MIHITTKSGAAAVTARQCLPGLARLWLTLRLNVMIQRLLQTLQNAVQNSSATGNGATAVGTGATARMARML